MTAQPGDITRNAYMDFLKGIAMIAVVAGHTLSDIRGMDFLFNAIYSFHMPLLFFVSAYIEEQYKEKYTGKESRMLLKRTQGLLLPYFSWTIICEAVSGGKFWYRAVLYHGIGGLWKIVEQQLIPDLIGYGENGFWFLPVLFGLKIMHAVYWSIRRKTGGDTIIGELFILGSMEIMAALLAFLTRQPYLINMLSYAIPYFFAILIVRHESVQKMISSEWLIAGAMLAYVLVFSHFSFYDTRWTTQVFRIGLSLSVIILCCKWRDKWKMNRFYSVLCVYGENSLAIYILYGFLIDYKEYFNLIDSSAIVGILSIALAFLVGAICIVFAKVIGISSWWKKILFGR